LPLLRQSVGVRRSPTRYAAAATQLVPQARRWPVSRVARRGRCRGSWPGSSVRP
jgi:hypothetical protein